MKLFSEELGKFQMFIPLEWEYKNPFFRPDSRAPYSFGDYDTMIGAFQISCKLVNDTTAKLIKDNRLDIQNSDSLPLTFTERFVAVDQMNSYMWMAAVDDHFILITYILDSEKVKSEKGTAEFSAVRKTLSTIKFIKPALRNTVIAENRFSLFMTSIAATIELRNKAIDSGSFIEYVVLSANHIDALLRLSIILTNQLENKNSEIDITILFQSEADRPILEKEIYKRVLDRKIIEQTDFDELISLYNERNKVVHRYIITDLKTEGLLSIAMRYGTLENKISDLVNSLEQQQFELKIGINGVNADNPPGRRLQGDVLKQLNYRIRDKHGRIKLSTKVNQ